MTFTPMMYRLKAAQDHLSQGDQILVIEVTQVVFCWSKQPQPEG